MEIIIYLMYNAGQLVPVHMETENCRIRVGEKNGDLRKCENGV